MKKSERRFFSLVLTLILAFALAVPAFATGVETGGSNSITITNSPIYTKDGTEMGADYSGYLLMTLVQSGDNYAYTVNPKYTDILLKVINENNADEADLTVADLTDRVPTAAENNAIVSWISTYVGEGADKRMNARDFTNAVYEEILALNSDADDENNIAADKIAGDEDDGDTDGTVILDSIAHGYWLIADTTTGIPEGATANRTSTLVILDTSNVEVTAKNKEMTITKDITNPDPTNVSDHNIGDTVNYTIVATIDPNMAQYVPADYKYIITDTLSKGVVYDLDPTNNDLEDFTESNVDEVKEAMGLTIKLDNDGDGIIEADEGEDLSDYFTVNLLGDDDGLDNGFTFTITGNTNWASSGKTGNVIVNYNAIVNKFAVVGGDGNPNEVDLEFSNNPNTNSTGETPKDIVTSFTYQLNVTKVDGNNSETKLKDARFALYRLVDDDVKEYVTIDDENKVSGWQKTLPTVTLNPDTPEEKTVNGNIVTDENGKVSVIGLDDGTYYLTECVAPDGYNLLDKDVKIKITAEYSLDGKTITKLTVTVDDEKTSNGNTANGQLEVTVENFSGNELPSTGGIGTTIFYALGGLLAVGAAVFLVTKKRMSGVEE